MKIKALLDKAGYVAPPKPAPEPRVRNRRMVGIEDVLYKADCAKLDLPRKPLALEEEQPTTPPVSAEEITGLLCRPDHILVRRNKAGKVTGTTTYPRVVIRITTVEAELRKFRRRRTN